jgi:hypothetical protein
MNKDSSIILYKTAMTVFKKLLHNGTITEAEFTAIDTTLLRKYGLSLYSIYR